MIVKCALITLSLLLLAKASDEGMQELLIGEAKRRMAFNQEVLKHCDSFDISTFSDPHPSAEETVRHFLATKGQALAGKKLRSKLVLSLISVDPDFISPKDPSGLLLSTSMDPSTLRKTEEMMSNPKTFILNYHKLSTWTNCLHHYECALFSLTRYFLTETLAAHLSKIAALALSSPVLGKKDLKKLLEISKDLNKAVASNSINESNLKSLTKKIVEKKDTAVIQKIRFTYTFKTLPQVLKSIDAMHTHLYTTFFKHSLEKSKLLTRGSPNAIPRFITLLKQARTVVEKENLSLISKRLIEDPYFHFISNSRELIGYLDSEIESFFGLA